MPDDASGPTDRPPDPARRALAGLWQAAGLPETAAAWIDVAGSAPVLPSSFDIATAAQASLGAAALAAAELWHLRRGDGHRQRVRVAREHAVLESCAAFTIDGRKLPMWDPLSGLYRCGSEVGAPGWVRLHANFEHHRDRALALLGCPTGPETGREAVAQALQRWRAEDFENAAADAGAVAAAVRSFDEWDAHPQAQAVAGQALVAIEPIAGAPPSPPRAWPALGPDSAPLQGLRVLDLTRILAGPVAGRTLAAYGADVMLVNSPALPNIAAIADTSRGKLSAHVDLASDAGRRTLAALLGDAHVFLQGYRPGALEGLGFGVGDVARLRPGIVAVSLSAYGSEGPWTGRRGFDSLVQSATGFNDAEAKAAGTAEPKAMPLQILDYAAGYLLAFGTQAALWRQARLGGSWQVKVSLVGVGRWLRSLGRVPGGLTAVRPSFDAYRVSEASGFGELGALRHAAEFSLTPPRWRRPSMPPGSHPPVWPAFD